MTKKEALNLPTDMTVIVVYEGTKGWLPVCPKLKETIVKNSKKWIKVS
jgi:hypothetical protein